MSIAADLPQALEKLHKLSLREEMDTFDRDRFVDFHQLSQLETHDWQVIFGRRGTGKTMLLNAFGDHIAKKERDSYCLYIDMRNCVPSASGIYDTSISDEQRAVSYFYEFIRIFAAQLFDEYTDATDLSPLQRLIRLVQGNRDTLDALILAIHEIAEYQPLRKVPLKGSEGEGNNGKNAYSTSVAAGIEQQFDTSELSVKSKAAIDGKISAASENSRSSQENIDYVFESARRYQPLRRKLEQLMEAVEVKRLYVLIDEWADLNRLKDDRVQAIFAEMLRKTFGGSNKITLKIASIKGVTKFNEWRSQGGIGLELNADIFVACDLDQVYCSEADAHTFYAEMMFKRLCKVDERIIKYSKTNEHGDFTWKPPEGFYSYLFKNEESLMDVVHGSGRIPRDFIQLFCSCAHERHFSISPPWKRGELLTLIKQHSIRTKDEIVGASAHRSELFNQILEIAKNTGSRVFLVRKDRNAETEKALSELYNYRLIHPTDSSKIPRRIRQFYNCYYADYGYFLEAFSEFSGDGETPACPIDIGTEEKSFENYTVELSGSSYIKMECCHCAHVFDSSAQSFIKKGLCPECFNAASRDPEMQSAETEPN